jgi:hypothetical protein
MVPQVIISLSEYNELLKLKEYSDEFVKKEAVEFAKWLIYAQNNPLMMLGNDIEESYLIFKKMVILKG